MRVRRERRFGSASHRLPRAGAEAHQLHAGGAEADVDQGLGGHGATDLDRDRAGDRGRRTWAEATSPVYPARTIERP